jgi:hypothetical protein
MGYKGKGKIRLLKNSTILAMTELLLFKTSVKDAADTALLAVHLDKQFRGRWNIDYWDKDKILRFIGTRAEVGLLVESVKNACFYCQEIEQEIRLAFRLPHRHTRQHKPMESSLTAQPIVAEINDSIQYL